jgi:hypothetical protein
MINYKASGTLKAAAPILGGGLHLILVSLGNQHVVSKYIEGQREWCNGHYFREFSQAYAYFIGELFEQLPVCDMDAHPRLAANVKKANGFLDKLAKEKA